MNMVGWFAILQKRVKNVPHSGYGDDPVGAWLLLRGGAVRHDRQEALPHGPPQPHLLQRLAPPLLHHRHRHGRPGNILLIPALQRKVDILRPAVNSTSSTPTPHSFSLIDNEEGHINKCVVFLTIWTLWNPNRMLFHFGMVFARWDEDLCRIRRLFLFCSSGSCMSVMPPDF